MTSPLEGKIAAAVGKAFTGIFYDATVIRTVPGTPTVGEEWVPVDPTTTEYPCKGMVDTYSDYAVANSLVDAQDRKILILASSLSITPTNGDKVTIRGATYTVLEVKTDPALSVWELRAKR